MASSILPLVAIGDGKWEVYVGGAGGAHVRKGDLFAYSKLIEPAELRAVD